MKSLMLEMDISEEIEDARQNMVKLGSQLGLLHPRVVESSENLDRLLLRYYHLEKAKSS
ncbi:aspartyl-phosphate phosphatase Spo0E family protein [Paenibacillus sp. J2TS4]|uniref:aspartyl-phosphate phosphatase Spo0E family protein n=1 Tax=Paenibacillus sp. J2TS4 TaxID=2807194 RepID=UPI0020BDE54D|nr:aspartyl-phosphate phosphatase Spo0E family protein [Paenibacillus sp. J2TS4]